MNVAGPTGFFMHPAASLHDTGWGHAEHQGRLRTLASTIGKDMLALHGHVVQVESPVCTEADLLRVHGPAHLEEVRSATEESAQSGSVVALDADTRVSAASWEAALGSCGGVIEAARQVEDGRLRNAFVAARPPGHHATPGRPMGFCLFNSVAVAARWLQHETDVERVLIVDFDVHHGNGTQDTFYADPSVYFVSLHQYPHWPPDSGSAEERGHGAGLGANLNVPLPAGTSRADYRKAFVGSLDQVQADGFVPDFVLVSAGFDALAGDPLGGLLLEPVDAHWLTRTLMEWAEPWCGGRVVASLEGGYDPARTALAANECLRALAGLEARSAVDEVEGASGP